MNVRSSALRFLIVTATCIFVAEAFIMIFLEALEPLGYWTTVFLDSLLILFCTIPALYVWLYRPIIRHISERDEAQRDVYESQQKLSFHLQNTPVAAIEWNLDFEVVEWNAAAQRIFGYTRDEALGRHSASLIVPDSAREQVTEIWSGLLENTGGAQSTNENLTKDGRTIFCDWNNTPLMDKFGKVCGVASLVQDITERKQAEDRVHLLLDNIPCVAMILKKGTREIVASNKAAYAIGAIPGTTCYETCAQRQETCVFCQAPEVWESGEPREVEVEREGVWYHGIWVPLDDDLYVHYIFDITERKQAEMALLASEERFRTQMVQSPLVMEIYDLDGLQIEVNKAYEELWGFPASTTVNKFNVLKSKEVEDTGLMDYVKRAYAGEAVTVPEYTFDPTGETESRGHGRVRWLSTKIYPLTDSSGNVTNIVISHEDITDRKQAEKALHESQVLIQTVMDNLPIGVAVTTFDPTVRFEYMNANFAKHYHTTLEALAEPDAFWDAVYEDPEFREKMKTRILDDSASGDPERMYWVDIPITRKGDRTYYVTARNTQIPDKQLMISTVWDVTEHKEAEEELALKNLVFESSLTANSTADKNGILTHVNNAFLRIWGYETKESVIGRPISDFFKYEHESEKVFTALSERGEWEGEFTAEKRDKTSFFAYSFGTIVKSHTGEKIGYQSIVMDITETKRLRELESRAERLETAGTIAGQVAHDFNNLLAPLIAYPDFIRENLPKDHPALAYVKDIEDSAKQIAEINQQLLSLGRRGHYNQEVLNLNVIIKQAVKEIIPLSDNLTLTMDLDAEILNVRGGGSQIHRVITNLLYNAIDALEGEGQITVKSENYYVDSVSVSYGSVPVGAYIKLTVSDTGRGIPDEILQRIFDPFFTSKTTDKKRGSGLGLSVVDAVVKDHGGYLDLSTKVGEGTSFYIYFPTTCDEAEVRNADKIVGGREKVLIVDDDEVQRDVSCKLLRRLGYDVNAVESGEGAIRFLKENPQDILVLDMVMPPGIDGAETYRQVLEICPGQRAIIVSGFSESDRVVEAQNIGAGAFIKKPLTSEAIANAVRAELDKNKRTGVR